MAILRKDHFVGCKRGLGLLLAVHLNERETPDTGQARLLLPGWIAVVKTHRNNRRQCEPHVPCHLHASRKSLHRVDQKMTLPAIWRSYHMPGADNVPPRDPVQNPPQAAKWGDQIA